MSVFPIFSNVMLVFEFFFGSILCDTILMQRVAMDMQYEETKRDSYTPPLNSLNHALNLPIDFC